MHVTYPFLEKMKQSKKQWFFLWVPAKSTSVGEIWCSSFFENFFPNVGFFLLFWAQKSKKKRQFRNNCWKYFQNYNVFAFYDWKKHFTLDCSWLVFTTYTSIFFIFSTLFRHNKFEFHWQKWGKCCAQKFSECAHIAREFCPGHFLWQKHCELFLRSKLFRNVWYNFVIFA